jgi:hypothetical protein
MNEGKAREAITRAAKAEALLRNELLQEGFDYLETQFIDAWRNSEVTDNDLYQLLKNLEALKGYFNTVIEDGKMANAQLEQVKAQNNFNTRKR